MPYTALQPTSKPGRPRFGCLLYYTADCSRVRAADAWKVPCLSRRGGVGRTLHGSQQVASHVSVGLGKVAGEPVEQQQLGAKREVLRVAGSGLSLFAELHEVCDEALMFLHVAFEEGVAMAAHQLFFGPEIGWRMDGEEAKYL